MNSMFFLEHPQPWMTDFGITDENLCFLQSASLLPESAVKDHLIDTVPEQHIPGILNALDYARSKGYLPNEEMDISFN